MFVLVYCFLFSEKKMQDFSPQTICASKFLPLENTAIFWVYFQLDSFKKFISHQSYNRCVVLGIFVRVLKDFLGTCMYF